MSSWETQSNRSTVETLLAMGFIPTWLEELLEEGDKLQENVRFLQKSVKVLGAVRGDWLEKYNESLVLVGQLQQANKDLAQLVLHITDKLEATRSKWKEKPIPADYADEKLRFDSDGFRGDVARWEKEWKDVLGE